MFMLQFLNRKIVFQFARKLKPRIPIEREEVENKLEQQQSFLTEQAEKQIRHAHSITDLKNLHNDIKQYADITSLIFKRLQKLKISSDEFEQHQQFVVEISNPKTYNFGLNLMQYYQNELVERILLDAYTREQLETNENNNLRMLDIIIKHGTEEQLKQWVENSDFKINAVNCKKFYHLLEQLKGKLLDRELLVNNLEKYIHKYTHQYDYETLFYILKYRSFNEKALNQDLLYAILRRLQQINLSLQQIIDINQYIMVELQYLDESWFNLVGINVLKALNKDNILQHQTLINNDNDDEEIIPDEQTIKRNDLEATESQDKIKDDEELNNLISDLELRNEPFVVTDLEKILLKLMEQLSKVIITDNLNLIALSYFKELDVHLMQFYNHLSTDEQLICIQFHAKYIETCHNEQQIDIKRYKKSSKKRLELMNNNYYEITLQCLKELSFEQTLKLLTSASVLGVSKRKVCQHILQLGITGLNKIDECKLENHNKNYALFVYFKLLQLFVTKDTDILYLLFLYFRQIQEQFKLIKINILDLQTEYSHLGLKRSQLQNLEEQQTNQS